MQCTKYQSCWEQSKYLETPAGGKATVRVTLVRSTEGAHQPPAESEEVFGPRTSDETPKSKIQLA